jgi:c(7)-type cytochrome triheme protein
MKTYAGQVFHPKIALLTAFLVFIAWASSRPVSEATETLAPEPIMVAQAEKKKPSPILDPNDPNSILYLDTSGNLAGTGDATKPVGEAWKAGMGWHPKALSAEGLPKDKYGLVDWVKIVNDKLLAPRHSIDPKAEELPPLKVEVTMPVEGDSINDVMFSHLVHTYWLNCEVCHPKIFVPKNRENEMNMIGIVQGKWCGRCHGTVAFPLSDCNRCHSIPKKAAK